MAGMVNAQRGVKVLEESRGWKEWPLGQGSPPPSPQGFWEGFKRTRERDSSDSSNSPTAPSYQPPWPLSSSPSSPAPNPSLLPSAEPGYCSHFYFFFIWCASNWSMFCDGSCLCMFCLIYIYIYEMKKMGSWWMCCFFYMVNVLCFFFGDLSLWLIDHWRLCMFFLSESY